MSCSGWTPGLSVQWGSETHISTILSLLESTEDRSGFSCQDWSLHSAFLQLLVEIMCYFSYIIYPLTMMSDLFQFNEPPRSPSSARAEKKKRGRYWVNTGMWEWSQVARTPSTWESSRWKRGALRMLSHHPAAAKTAQVQRSNPGLDPTNGITGRTWCFMGAFFERPEVRRRSSVSARRHI